MTAQTTLPGEDELELTLFGPGYGEAIAVHIGNGKWILVDSCLGADDAPRTLQYLHNIGVNPAEAVALVVATHWHDDHIRGIAQLADECREAAFCCSAVLNRAEFLSVVGRMETNPLSRVSSGVREIHEVFSNLRRMSARPRFATANRRILSDGRAEVWSLSPHDGAFQKFLDVVGRHAPDVGERKARVRDLSPNEVAIVLWIQIADVVLLLGSDLERPGWIEILQSQERPKGRASVFKIPHHGSANAHVPDLWTRMLSQDPFAVLTPWRRGGHSLPRQSDVARILGCTPNAYATARPDPRAAPSPRRDRAVERTIRESGITLQRPEMSPGSLRLRYPLGTRAGWQVEMFGSACRL